MAPCEKRRFQIKKFNKGKKGAWKRFYETLPLGKKQNFTRNNLLGRRNATFI